MSFSDFKVVRVMRWGNLHASGSKFHIYIFIRNHRNVSVHHWKDQRLADQVLITRIVWMDCDCRIAKHRLWTGRGNLYKPAFFSCYRILDMPKMPLLVYMFYLSV